MRQDLDIGIGKSVYASYITCIEKYFLPYFQDKRLEEITYTDVHEFEVWRNRQMNKVPRASTLNNFASAWTKLQLFIFSNGYQPPSLNGTFRRLMRDSGLEKNSEGQTRTLYSLRHTFATFELIENRTDLHTLAKQMGNSATMIERHYSKLTATMAADRLA
jgi:integrase